MHTFAYPGRKDTIKACIYVKELVRFMLYRLEHHEEGVELYNCTFEPAYTIQQIVDTIKNALLVSKHFSEPFKDSNGYGESIARLSNMLGGGVMVQRFGDLVRGRRSTVKRVEEGIVRPTLSATPGDLSLVLPKRILDGIIEMIYALDKIAPGTANDDTLLYGVEVKFYNMEVQLDEHLESIHKGLYIIGDGSGVTHSLSDRKSVV